MPHNILSWQTKEIEKLTVPAEDFFAAITTVPPGVSYSDVEYSDGALFMTVGLGDLSEIKIAMTPDLVDIEDIFMAGEWSGTTWHDCIRPLLRRSTGVLRALIVWHGGEIIEKLIVEDGRVSLERIDVW